MLSRNAGECLLVMLFACAQQTKVVSQIKWPTKTAFGDWLKQLQGQREGTENKLVLSCLGYLDLTGCFLYFQDLFRAMLIYSDLQHIKANELVLVLADLTGAKCQEKQLSNAQLKQVKAG